MEKQKDGQHGLVNVAVADALVEQVAGVPDHRLQRVLPHDCVELVSVEVVEEQLVPELPEVVDGGGAAQAGKAGTSRFGFSAIGQVQAAAATV